MRKKEIESTPNGATKKKFCDRSAESARMTKKAKWIWTAATNLRNCREKNQQLQTARNTAFGSSDIIKDNRNNNSKNWYKTITSLNSAPIFSERENETKKELFSNKGAVKSRQNRFLMLTFVNILLLVSRREKIDCKYDFIGKFWHFYPNVGFCIIKLARRDCANSNSQRKLHRKKIEQWFYQLFRLSNRKTSGVLVFA